MDTQFWCGRCGQRTTKQLSIGMLQCAYHPHIEGPLRPYSALHAVSREHAKGCMACALTYINLDHSSLANTHGCTSVDHLDPSENLMHLLVQRPYEVMPIKHFKGAPFAAFQPTAFVSRRKNQCGGKPTILYIKNEKQMLRFRLRLKLFGPEPTQCALPDNQTKAHENGICLSLVSLYNESASLYDYPSYNSSGWIKKVLHANRFALESGEKERTGGIIIMNEEKVLDRELYSDEHIVEEHREFVPFVVILRVEIEQLRVEEITNAS